MRKLALAALAAALLLPMQSASAAPSCTVTEDVIRTTGSILLVRGWETYGRVVCQSPGEVHIAVGIVSFSPGMANGSTRDCTGTACSTTSGSVYANTIAYCLQSLVVGWQDQGSEKGGYTWHAESKGCDDIPAFMIKIKDECSKSLDACLQLIGGGRKQ